jgi:hypothetical protein
VSARTERALVLVKLLHTFVWALFVACIAGIFVSTARGRLGVAAALIAAVTGEVLVLVANRMRCPLTDLAARYTAERRANFDIYLPRWLAKRNQEIFGPLYLAGLAYTLVEWLR